MTHPPQPFCRALARLMPEKDASRIGIKNTVDVVF